MKDWLGLGRALNPLHSEVAMGRLRYDGELYLMTSQAIYKRGEGRFIKWHPEVKSPPSTDA